MNLTILLSLLACLVGVVVYAVANNGKLSEIGRIAYGCGLLAFLLTFSGRAIHIAAGP